MADERGSSSNLMGDGVMYFTEMARVLRRHWIVALLGFVVTLAASFGATLVVPPGYSVSATVLLLPPVNPPEKGEPPANPYLQLGGLSAPTEVLARALNDPSVQDEMSRLSPGTEYTATRDIATSAPVLIITAMAGELDQARKVRDGLVAKTPGLLKQLQQDINVPVQSQITSTVISPDVSAQRVNRPTIRAVLVVAVLGVLGTLGLATLAEIFAVRRVVSRPKEPLSAPASRVDV